jgi:hypothetical protein
VGQCRPTPLFLHCEEGGFNCLQQGRYGEVACPLQVVILPSRTTRDRECDGREADFEGGEFLLTEQQQRQ